MSRPNLPHPILPKAPQTFGRVQAVSRPNLPHPILPKVPQTFGRVQAVSRALTSRTPSSRRFPNLREVHSHGLFKTTLTRPVRVAPPSLYW